MANAGNPSGLGSIRYVSKEELQQMYPTPPTSAIRKNKKLETQVGGDHYQGFRIQPMEYILANDIGFVEGSVIKYVSRWKNKNGVQDLRKAIQNLEVLIEDALANGMPDDPAFAAKKDRA